MTKAEIVRSYLERFPETENRTLAKLLHKELPNVFMSPEAARDIIRRLRGAKGKRHTKYAMDKSAFKPLGWQKDVIPKTLARTREPIVLSGALKVLILSDIHIPYHDEIAVAAAIAHGKKKKPDVIILNGDIGDFYGVSRHDKDPRRSLADELDAIRQFLFYLRKQFPNARILYKIGNHEARMEMFLVKNAPVLLGVSDFELPVLLKFDESRIELVPSLTLIRLGSLPIYHGHELPQGMSSPVNPARGIWMRVQESLICGHWHRTSEHTESTGLNKKLSSCWSTGCLCDLTPDYAIVNRWNHGFAWVETQSDGNYEVTNHKIINGRVY
jgi:metallophosphoesterase superfamily enzyme